MRTVLLAAAIAVASCRPETEAPLGSPFEIAAGRLVHVAGTDLRLEFARVVSDSRCPRGVDCIAAGEAVVSILAGPPGGDREALELHVPGGAPPRGSSSMAFAGYRIRVEDLKPVPTAGVATDSSAYTVTLVVER